MSPARYRRLLVAALSIAIGAGIGASRGAAESPPSDVPEPSPAASEMLKAMREKGILTEEEYEELYRRQAKYEVEQQQREELPWWVRDWTFGGDMRLRYERRDYGDFGFGDTLTLGKDNVQVVRNPNTATGLENVFQLRLRLGAEKRLNENATFGFRIATSSATTFGAYNDSGTGVPGGLETRLDANPVSGNVNLGDFFSPKNIYLDRAYLRFNPRFAPSFEAQVGKFANPFRSPYFETDYMEWDDDVSPEGVAATYRFDFVPETVWLDTNAGIFLLDQQGSINVDFNQTTGTATGILPNPDDRNPFIWAIQGGLNGRPNDWIQMGFRTTYYDWEQISPRVAAALEDNGNGGDAINNNPLLVPPLQPSQGSLQQLVLDGYTTFSPWGDRWAITPWVQYSTILNATSEDVGIAAGFNFGTEDFLRLTFTWARVQRNGAPSIFQDSDLFEGFTNAEGWRVSVARRITQGIRLRAAFFQSTISRKTCELANVSVELCGTATQIPELGDYRKTTLDRTRLQVDMLVDF